MPDGRLNDKTLGWVGCGRMGQALATRLLQAGCELAVYNRTRSKAEPLAELGATIVERPAELGDRDIVFTTLAGLGRFRAGGDRSGRTAVGLRAPSVIVDSTTISAEASERVRAHATERGTALLAAPVSGNPKVVKAGRLTMVISGPEAAYEVALPFLETLAGGGVTYAGEGDRARLVKVCHNLMLGIVAQTLAEILVLGEKGGVSRASMMEFLNNSVLGSTFTRYKTPAYVNLDFSPTFTPPLLLKDFDLGYQAARELGVPMPVAAAAQQAVQALIGDGYDRRRLRGAHRAPGQVVGLELQSEAAPVSDGLERAA